MLVKKTNSVSLLVPLTFNSYTNEQIRLYFFSTVVTLFGFLIRMKDNRADTMGEPASCMNLRAENVNKLI